MPLGNRDWNGQKMSHQSFKRGCNEKVLLIDTDTTLFNEVFPVYPTDLDYLQRALKEKEVGETHVLDPTQMGCPLTSLNFQ